MMKTLLRPLLAVCLLWMMLTSTALAVSVVYQEEDVGQEIVLNSKVEDDLFDNFKNVMPGDVLTQPITITNNATQTAYLDVYLKAEAGEENTAFMEDFLSQMTLTVTLYQDEETIIYEASPSETGQLTEFQFLGSIRAGESVTMDAVLEVPMEMGNQYANMEGEVVWVFYAEAFAESQLTVRKVWSDGNDHHSKQSVTVNLLQDGEIADTVILSAENQWTYTFDGLVELYDWTVEEESVPHGYEVSYKTVGNVTTITNKKKSSSSSSSSSSSGSIDFTVEKKWVTEETHPSQVTVALYDGEIRKGTAVLSEENDWQYTWVSLSGDGNWMVVEINIPEGYTPTYSIDDDRVVIINIDNLLDTGQLWLPVFILLGAGLALVAVGGFVIGKKRGHHE